MWIQHKNSRSDFVRFSQTESFPLKKNFQKRYITLITTFVLLTLVAVMTPLIYFFHENYEIFIQLAYKNSPELVQHLEREKAWVNTYLIISLITAMIFTITLVSHIISRIIGPLLVLQSHLKSITRGNWSVKDLKVRDNDEFRDLVSSYNYFYYSLRQMVQSEIDELKSFAIDPVQKSNYEKWRRLIHKKSEQIGLPVASETSSSSEPSLDSRHAS